VSGLAECADAGVSVDLPDKWAQCALASLLSPYHYADILREVYKHFEARNVLVVRFADVVEHTERTVREIFDFLGLEQDVELPDLRQIKPEDIMEMTLEAPEHAQQLSKEDRAFLETYFQARNEDFAAMMGTSVADLWRSRTDEEVAAARPTLLRTGKK